MMPICIAFSDILNHVLLMDDLNGVIDGQFFSNLFSERSLVAPCWTFMGAAFVIIVFGAEEL